MDTDRMKIMNPTTGKAEYVIGGEDNQVDDLNRDRLDRQITVTKKEKPNEK